MNAYKITLPFTTDLEKKFKIGDKLLLSGKIFTARDMAHMKLMENINEGRPLPFDVKSFPIYYCGPTPAKEGYPIGSCGPTTSKRMDQYVKQLLIQGSRCMIGKGERSLEVTNLIKEYKALYLVAIGGAGALYAKTVTNCKCIAYEELGAEAVYEMDVLNFPVFVFISD